MKIYLLDKNSKMTKSWKFYFTGCNDVEVVNMYLHDFLSKYDVECIVSPANSYGIMDGGYDYAISEYFGWELSKKVQKKILDECFGEQLVGTSIILDIDGTNKKLIHTPSMRTPSRIKDPMIVYYCTRATLICAIKNNINSIVIPAFGGDCGGLDSYIIALMMKEAYDQVMNPPKEINWKYAYRRRLEEIN
mgnify:CR=1 FL=1